MVASKQASIQMHVRNAVTLVWGLLRLAPIILGEMYIQYKSTSTKRDCTRLLHDVVWVTKDTRGKVQNTAVL